MIRTPNGSRTFLVLGSAVLACAGLGGCYSEEGAGISLDEHTYISTSWQPKTVYLQDTRTREVIWSVDVPVGKQLVVKIRKDLGTKDGMTPDLMVWDIMEPGKSFGVLNNSVPVPGGDNKQLSWKLRPAPELPEGTGGAGRASAPPPKEPPIKVAPDEPAKPGPGTDPAGEAGKPPPPPAAPPPPPPSPASPPR